MVGRWWRLVGESAGFVIGRLCRAMVSREGGMVDWVWSVVSTCCRFYGFEALSCLILACLIGIGHFNLKDSLEPKVSKSYKTPKHYH